MKYMLFVFIFLFIPVSSGQAQAPGELSLESQLKLIVEQWQSGIQVQESTIYRPLYHLPVHLEVIMYDKGEKNIIVDVNQPVNELEISQLNQYSLIVYPDMLIEPVFILTNPDQPQCQFKLKRLIENKEDRKIYDHELRSLTFSRLDGQWKIIADKRIFFLRVPEYKRSENQINLHTVNGFLTAWRDALISGSPEAYLNLYNKTYSDFSLISNNLDMVAERFYDDVYLDTQFRRDFYEDQIKINCSDGKTGNLILRLNRINQQWKIIDEFISLIDYEQTGEPSVDQVIDRIRRVLTIWHKGQTEFLGQYYLPTAKFIIDGKAANLNEVETKIIDPNHITSDVFVTDLKITSDGKDGSVMNAEIWLQTNLLPQMEIDVARRFYQKWNLTFVNKNATWMIQHHSIIVLTDTTANEELNIESLDLNTFLNAWRKAFSPHFNSTAYEKLCSSLYHYTHRFELNTEFYKSQNFSFQEETSSRYQEIRGIIALGNDGKLHDKKLMLKYSDNRWWLIEEKTLF